MIPVSVEAIDIALSQAFVFLPKAVQEAPELKSVLGTSSFSGDKYVRVRYRIAQTHREAIVKAATELKLPGVSKMYETIDAAIAGDFSKPLPNFLGFEPVIRLYFLHNRIRGWVYRTGSDGKALPWAVAGTDAHVERNDSPPSITIRLEAYKPDTSEYRDHSGTLTVKTAKVSLQPTDITRRTVEAVLAGADLVMETEELNAEHDKSVEHFTLCVRDGFSKQYHVSGKIAGEYPRDKATFVVNRRAIHDLPDKAFSPVPDSAVTDWLPEDVITPMPVHPICRLFCLKDHRLMWVHGDFLTPYQYNKGLRDKLILPEAHRDLLDILTTDLECFVTDIIAGKSAGNIVLLRGIPGVGKTLTPEVYSELVERPLLSVHTGVLGTDPTSIQRGLEKVFGYYRRWGCVLLLDEADVFMRSRAQDITQNAIVAEFLRTLEYFEGLMFLTTNLGDNIDDAIVSRCAAVISYETPDTELRREVWEVMFAQFHTTPPEGLVDQLVSSFPEITPRDIKLLLRLVLRVCKARSEPLVLDMFRKCSMFRAVKFVPQHP